MSASFTYETKVTYNNTGGSASIVFPAINVSTGELIQVEGRWEGGLDDGATITVSDTAGNTYSSPRYAVTGDGSEDQKVFEAHCLSCTGHASNIVTITISASRSYREGSVAAFSYTGTIEEGDIGSGSSSTGVSPFTTTPALDVVSGDLTTCVFGNYNSSTYAVTPTGYTNLWDGDYAVTAYKIATGTGTEQPSSTPNGSDTYAALTTVFQEAAATATYTLTAASGSFALTGNAVTLTGPVRVTLVETSTNNTDNTTSMSLSVPTGTVDDDVILFFGSCDGTGYSLPTGFTSLHDVATGGTHKNILAYRVASSEPASYTISVASGSERGWGIFATYRNVDTVSPIDGSNSNTGGSNTTAVMSSLTPSVNDCAVAVFAGLESGNAGNGIATSWPSTVTEQNDNVNGPPGTGAGSSAGAFGDVIQTTAAAVSGNIALTGGNTFWGVMAVALAPAPTGDTYTLIAASGSFTQTGQATALKVGRKLTAATASYSLSGIAAAFKTSRKLLAVSGSYALTGNTATLTYTPIAGPDYTLVSDVGSFTLAGQAVSLKVGRKIAAASGSYTLTGYATTLKASRTLGASDGSYSLTGIDASFKAGRSMAASSGAYTLTGIATGLTAGRKITAASGSFSLTGYEATLDYSNESATYSLVAANGAYALSGQAVVFSAGRKLIAATSAYLVTGYDTGLIKSSVLSAAASSYSLTGQDTGLVVNRKITAANGSYTLSGIDAALKASRQLALNSGSYALTGIDATLTYNRLIGAISAARTHTIIPSSRTSAASSNRTHAVINNGRTSTASPTDRTATPSSNRNLRI